MPKLGRNDKCDCDSGKKYKKCCEQKIKETKYTTGQNNSSPKIHDVILTLQNKFINYRVIDITDDLSYDNYKEYQLTNYNTNIVMVAEKQLNNNIVFIEREENALTDILIMYRGSYRSFQYTNLHIILDSLHTMIK